MAKKKPEVTLEDTLNREVPQRVADDVWVCKQVPFCGDDDTIHYIAEIMRDDHLDWLERVAAKQITDRELFR